MCSHTACSFTIPFSCRFFSDILLAASWEWYMGGNTKAALHRCSYKKVFWKYAANSQENKRAQQLYWNHNTINIYQFVFNKKYKNVKWNWLPVNKKIRNARTVFTKFQLISQLVLVFLMNKLMTATNKQITTGNK